LVARQRLAFAAWSSLNLLLIKRTRPSPATLRADGGGGGGDSPEWAAFRHAGGLRLQTMKAFFSY